MRAIACFLLCLSALCLRAQPVLSRFETLGVNEGLSQSSVYAIFQDRAGYMWFGTADGLNRYDGAEVRVFRCPEELQAPGSSNYVRGSISEDAQGDLWYANETGIYRFDRRLEQLRAVLRFSFARFQNTIFLNVGLHGGRLWLVNMQHGVFAYEPRSGSLEAFPFPGNFPIANCPNNNGTLMPNGDILFCPFLGKGYVRFRARDRRFYRECTDRDMGLVAAGRGKAFFVARGGFHTYDSASSRFSWVPCRIDGQPVNNIINILEDPYGRIWLTTTGSGLLLYDPARGTLQSFRHDNARQRSLPIDLLRDAYLDRQNNLWVGTDGAGVCRLDLKPPRFRLFPQNEGDYPALKDYFTKCFYEDRRGRIWFGGHNNGFSIYDPRNGTLRAFSYDPARARGLAGNIVGAIAEDATGAVWIGHSMGFSRYDERADTFLNLRPTPLPRLDRMNIYVYQLRLLRDGRLLAATQSGLATVRKTERGYTAKAFAAGALSSQTTSVIETAPGDIWYTCPLVGLYHARARGDSFEVLEKYFTGIDLRSLHSDGRDPGILWIGSAKGLIRFDLRSRRYRLYDTRQGMANAYVYGILEDEQHNFWLSTNGGLTFFDRGRETFTNYNAADGLQSNEFNTNAYHRGRSGTFYFGGIKGFNWFEPASFRAERHRFHPQVAIALLAVNEKPLLPGPATDTTRTVRLSHGQNNLMFRFAALDFTRPSANKLHYRLEGWDPGWVTTANPTVRYASLPPGSYRLRVRALNADGLVSPVEDLLLVIEAPFWKRPWFFALLGGLLLTGVVLLTRSVAQRNIRRRLEVLERERAIEAERNRISKDMHDEIGSGLTQIALLSELIQAQQKAEEDLKKDVATISAQARRLVRNMGEIVWTLNPQNDSLENLLAYIREQAQDYFEPFDLRFVVDYPERVPALKLSSEQRRNLLLVVKEALHNALKHAGATEIRLQLQAGPQQLRFRVSDNGNGLGKKIRAGANGLRNMEKRMLDIGGEFALHSTEKGTTVSFTLNFRSLI